MVAIVYFSHLHSKCDRKKARNLKVCTTFQLAIREMNAISANYSTQLGNHGIDHKMSNFYSLVTNLTCEIISARRQKKLTLNK